MAGGTKTLEKVKGMYIRFAPLLQADTSFQMFSLVSYFEISIYDAQYLLQLLEYLKSKGLDFTEAKNTLQMVHINS